MIEKMYGAGSFYEDAANFNSGSLRRSSKESGLEIVSQPKLMLHRLKKEKHLSLQLK